MEIIEHFIPTPPEHFVLYWHQIGTTVIWIDVCQLVDVFRAPKAHTNSRWLEYARSGHKIDLKILATSPTHDDELTREFSRYLNSIKPECNFYGHEIRYRHGTIVCITDDKEHATQTAAAKFYGISASALSNHLARKPGHKTVGGLTFKHKER